jgi:hypothetical protein
MLSTPKLGPVILLVAVTVSACSETDSFPVQEENRVTYSEPLLPIALDGKIGELRDLPPMPVARAHWGGNSSSQEEFVYEPPQGWIIYSVQERLLSKYGDSWYTPQLTSAGANYVAETKFMDTLDELQQTAGQFNNYRANAELKEARKAASQWLSKLTSANNALHIRWGGHSQEVYAGPIPVVIDTHTASLNLDVVITLARTLSTSELDVIVPALKQRIRRGESLAPYVAIPGKASITVADNK